MKPEMFFSQMRVMLKATEKSYQEATKDLTTEQKEDTSIAFNIPSLGDKHDDKEMQDIELVIYTN